VIVGAGLAGLSAADTLINKHGFTNVTIFEATERIGGRIHPVLFPQDSSGRDVYNIKTNI